MGQFSNYPAAAKSDYTDDATLLIQNTSGDTKLANLEDSNQYYFANVKKAPTLSIGTVDVLQLNSTPQEAVPASGASKVLEPIAAFYKLDFNSAAYATNTTIQIKLSGADVACLESNTLGATVGRYVKFDTIPVPTAGQTQLLANAAINVTVKTGDPVTGDSDIEVFILYREVEV